MEEYNFEYGKYSYKYFLVKEDRKTVSLTVKPNLSIVLKCPFKYSEEKTDRFLKRKWSWLERQINFFKKYNKQKRKKEYISGESFLYLGRQYKLIVKKGSQDSVKLDRGILNIVTTKTVADSKYNKTILDNWYQARIQIIFEEEYGKVLKRFRLDFTPKLITRKMNKRWGSYLAGKKIILNPMLIQASKECISYVIIHELCHMTNRDHDKNFYKLLKSKIHNWEQIKEKLELRFI